MPRFDFKCPACSALRKDVWLSTYRAGQDHVDISPCDQCGTPLEKVPAAPSFTVKGFNAKNGYSK